MTDKRKKWFPNVFASIGTARPIVDDCQPYEQNETYWRGKPLREMTRDELIGVIEQLDNFNRDALRRLEAISVKLDGWLE